MVCMAGESSGNWHRLVGANGRFAARHETPLLLLYTYYGTVLAMWLFRSMWKSWF